jgi:hypothetical protein
MANFSFNSKNLGMRREKRNTNKDKKNNKVRGITERKEGNRETE